MLSIVRRGGEREHSRIGKRKRKRDEKKNRTKIKFCFDTAFSCIYTFVDAIAYSTKTKQKKKKKRNTRLEKRNFSLKRFNRNEGIAKEWNMENVR